MSNNKSAFKAKSGVDGVAIYVSGQTYSAGSIREKDLVFYKSNQITSTSFIPSEWDVVGAAAGTNLFWEVSDVTSLDSGNTPTINLTGTTGLQQISFLADEYIRLSSFVDKDNISVNFSRATVQDNSIILELNNNGNSKSITIPEGSNGIRIHDSDDQIGLVYVGDYSTNGPTVGGSLWIPHIGYIDNNYWKVTGTTNVTNPTISGNTIFDGNLNISGNTIFQTGLTLVSIPVSGTSDQLLIRDASTGEVKYTSLGDLGGGDVIKVGTPVDNQIGVWTGDGTIEGDPNFLWDGSALTVVGTITGNTFVTSGGTSSQFVKGDGSLDTNTYEIAGTNDNYQYWTITADTGTENIGPTNFVYFSGGTNISTTYDTATNRLRIDSTGATVDETLFWKTSGTTSLSTGSTPTINLTGSTGLQQITWVENSYMRLASYTNKAILSSNYGRLTIGEDAIIMLVDNSGGAKQIVIAGYATGIDVTDSDDNIGFTYTADYSVNGVAQGDRWIPDLGYNNSTYWKNSGTTNVTNPIISGNTTFDGIITGNSFVTSGGTSSQFVKGDGSLDPNTYEIAGTNDNYQYWTITADTGTENISSTDILYFSGGTDITTTYDPATNRLRIDFNGTDANTFLTGATFNTGDGILTLTKNDDTTVTVDLDDRYELAGTNDNYVSWTASGDTGSDAVTSGQNLYFSGGTGIITNVSGEVVGIYTSNIPNSSLQNSTISGVALGGNLSDLTIGTGLSGSSSTYNGGTAVTIVHDDTSTLEGSLGSTGISSIGVDEYGHITGVSTTTYDNYQYWTITADTGTENISSTDFLHFSGGTDISTTYDSATNRLRIDFTGAADTNTFLTGATFNTGDGVITLTKNDDTTVTVDIDGRYVELSGGDYWKTTGTTNVTTPTISGDTTFDGNLYISGQTYIQSGLTLTTVPTSGSSDQALIRNTTTGAIEYKSLASLGGGDVTKSGTAADNQVAVWVTDGSIEGDNNFLWDGSSLTVIGDITGNTFITSGGTSSQFVKGDGSLDPNTYEIAGTNDNYQYWLISGDTGGEAINSTNSVFFSGGTNITTTYDSATNRLLIDSSAGASALSGLTDVTITSIASGEIIKWNGSEWVNNTLAEAGIQPAGSYDNYVSWTASGDSGSDSVTSTQNLYFSGGTGIVTNVNGEIVGFDVSNVPNSSLQNSTISGIALGGNLSDLTIGTGLSGSSSTYNGGTAVTIIHDDTSTLEGQLGGAGISSIGVDEYGHVTGVSTTTYDNYSGWTIAADTGSEAILSTDTLTISGGTNITTTYEASTNRLRIDASAGASAFSGLTDVTLTSPANGELLYYNSGQWVNATGLTWTANTFNIYNVTGGTMYSMDSSGNTTVTHGGAEFGALLTSFNSTGGVTIELNADVNNTVGNEASNPKIVFSQDGGGVKGVIGLQETENLFFLNTTAGAGTNPYSFVIKTQNAERFYIHNGNPIDTPSFIEFFGRTSTVTSAVGATVQGSGVIRINEVTTVPQGSLSANGGLLFVSGTSLYYHSSGGTTTDLTAFGSGDVTKVGTPANDEVAVWTGDGTVEGATGLTWNSTTNTLSTKNATGGTLFNVDGSGNTTISAISSNIDAIHKLQGVGDVRLHIEADTGNLDQNYNPQIKFTQKAGASEADIGWDNQDVFYINVASARDLKIMTQSYIRLRINNASTSTVAYDFPNANGFNGSSGRQAVINIDKTISQTGGAGYTGIQLNMTETTVGSGANYLMDLQVNGISKFNVNGGTGDTAIYIASATTTPSTPASGGTLFVSGNSIYFKDTTGTDTNLGASGSGDVTKVNTPADNQVGVWTGDGTIEGATGLTWNNNELYIASATTTPSTPSSGGTLFVSGNSIYFKDTAGTDYNLVTAGSGDVLKVGVPVNNQIGVWTGDGTIEGTTGFTWNDNEFFIASASTSVATPSGGGTLFVSGNSIYFKDTTGTDTDLTAGGGGNSLDQAYDQGGAGTGRTITVDSGAVELTYETAANNTVENLLTLTHTTSNVTTFGDTGLGSSIDFITTDGTAATTKTIGRISVYKDNGDAGTQTGYIEFDPRPSIANASFFRIGNNTIDWGDRAGGSSNTLAFQIWGSGPDVDFRWMDNVDTADPAIKFSFDGTRRMLENLANRQTFMNLSPVVDHTASALGYTIFEINVAETNIVTGGTGNFLIDAQVDSISKFNVTNDGTIFMASATTTPNTPSSGGTLFVSGNSIYFKDTTGTDTDLTAGGGGITASSTDTLTNKTISGTGNTISIAYSTRTVTGTTDTLTNADLTAVIYYSNTGTTTVNVVTGLTSGFNATIVNLGGGTINISGGTGITLEGNTTLSNQYAGASIIHSDVSETYTIFIGDGVGASTTDTLTNKTIDADNNTITNIGFSEIKIDLITGFTTTGATSGDFILISDTSDGGALKKADVNDFLGGTNTFTTGATFNTSDGVITLTRNDDFSFNVDIDGRFTTSANTETFTNKTIDADGTGNVITNIGSSEIKSEIITGFDTTGITSGDTILFSDVSDSGNLKKADAIDFLTQTKAITIESPTASENITMFYTDAPLTILKAADVIIGADAVAWNLNHDIVRTGGTSNTLFESDRIASNPSGATTTTFTTSGSTVPADSWIWFTSSALTGTPTQLNVTIKYALG